MARQRRPYVSTSSYVRDPLSHGSIVVETSGLHSECFLPSPPYLPVEESEPKPQRCSDKDHGEHANSNRVPRNCCAREPQRKFQCQQNSTDDTRHTPSALQQSLVTLREIRLLNRSRFEIVATVASRGVWGIHEFAIWAVHLH